MARKTPHCNKCGRDGHYGISCPYTPRKPIAVKTPIKRSTKPIKKVGKKGKEIANAVAKWKRQQEPNHEGYFICYICGDWIPYLRAEHVKSKARHPSLRTDPKNLKPTCDDCNAEKGSKDN